MSAVRYGVACGFGGINAGRISASGGHFASKNDVTDEAVAAVGEYVLIAFDGGAEFTFPNLRGGLRIQVTVEPLAGDA